MKIELSNGAAATLRLLIVLRIEDLEAAPVSEAHRIDCFKVLSLLCMELGLSDYFWECLSRQRRRTLGKPEGGR